MRRLPISQQNIDFCSFPNDTSADAIRTAFQKVQTNFTELFTGLQSQAVLTVNAGSGVTVNSPTGNVIVNANISEVQFQTSTLSIGRGSNGNSYASITEASQVLYVDLPANITGVTNITISGNLSATTGNVTANVLAGNI